MEVDTQSKLDKLVSKNPAVSDFETTLDGLKGEGQNLLWTGKLLVLPIPSTNYEINYAETLKLSLMRTKYPYLAYAIRAENTKRLDHQNN